MAKKKVKRVGRSIVVGHLEEIRKEPPPLRYRQVRYGVTEWRE